MFVHSSFSFIISNNLYSTKSKMCYISTFHKSSRFPSHRYHYLRIIISISCWILHSFPFFSKVFARHCSNPMKSVWCLFSMLLPAQLSLNFQFRWLSNLSVLSFNHHTLLFFSDFITIQYQFRQWIVTFQCVKNHFYSRVPNFVFYSFCHLSHPLFLYFITFLLF